MKRGETKIEEYPVLIICHQCGQELMFEEVETTRAIEFHILCHVCGKSRSKLRVFE